MRRDDVATARGREAVLVLWGAIALGVIVRLLVFRGSGFPSDVATFMAWGERMAAVGPKQFYAPGYFSDYPPGFLYVLWIVGALFDGEALHLVVKGLSIPADIGVAVLLYRLVRGVAGAPTGALAGALWMLQPGPIFAGPYWGQVDAWGTLPFLGALIAAGSGRWAVAGALAGVAGMIKPQFGIVGIVVIGAALIELYRERRWRPLAASAAGAALAAVLIALPFWAGADQPLTPGAFVKLVRSASETYPYTSLFAFNGWSIVADFWKPDDSYVAIGAVLLAAGMLASLAPLWSRRDVATLLASGAFAAMAFYFLPTRAHERYLFPAFALLIPFAVTRPRMLWPYVVLALAFFTSLYFAFTRYPQNGLVAAPFLEATIFSRPGQIALALVMIAGAAIIVWRLARGEARLDAAGAPFPAAVAVGAREPWRLPPGLGWGHAPMRRDLVVALAVALAVIATRGFRLDQPRDMYFDEVYHARTAFELLAQREPYEWTHPHLAKELMALGIAAFGGDRVEGRERAPADPTAFAISGEGVRAYGSADGSIELRDRGGAVARTLSLPPGPVRALGFDGTTLVAATDQVVAWFDLTSANANTDRRTQPVADRPTALTIARGTIAVVGTARGVEIHDRASDRPRTVAIPTAALTVKPDSSEVYVADDAGGIHVVDVTLGQETARVTGGGPATALAYARGPERLFAARAGEAAIDWYEPPRAEEGHREGLFGGTVPLSNGRTGSVSGAIAALAIVPRTQFLYALTSASVVAVETHGAAPFAAIPTDGRMLGMDGTGDALAVAGPSGLELVPTGRHALAWRLPGVIAAGALAFFLVLIARRLFASDLVPLLAGAAVVLDGSMFAQARIGMNDIYVCAFLVAGWYFVISAHAPRRSAALDLVIAGTLFGLAAASKWAAIYALAGLGLLSVALTAYAWSRGRPGTGGPFDLAAPRGPRWLFLGRANAPFLLLCFLALPVAVYLASYLRWFGGPTIPFGWSLWEMTQQMYWYHSGLTSPHPAGSPWWSWPLVLKPVYWYLGQPGPNATAVIYDAGNIILFWGGLAASVWAAVAAIRARSLSLGFLVFAMLTQYVAWIPITRVLFFYHFFTALPFYLLILAAALAALWESGRRALVSGYLAVATAAFAFFYPFISGQPVPADQAAVFFVLPTWQYDCQFYPAFRCDNAFRPDIPVGIVASRLAVALGVALLAFASIAAVRDGSGAKVRSWIARALPRRPATG